MLTLLTVKKRHTQKKRRKFWEVMGMFSIFIVLMVYAGVQIHQKCILVSFIYISYTSIKLKKKSKTRFFSPAKKQTEGDYD